ncbi:MAG: hypothetical protein ACTS27_07340 [Phycisphaerales bacterium]
MVDDPAIGKARLFLLALSLLLLSIDTGYSSSPDYITIDLTPALFGALLAAVCLFAPRILNKALHTAFWLSCLCVALEFVDLAVRGLMSDQPNAAPWFSTMVWGLRAAAVLFIGVTIYLGVALAAPRYLKPRTRRIALGLAIAFGATWGATESLLFISHDAFLVAGWMYLGVLFLAFAFPFAAETPLDG